MTVQLEFDRRPRALLAVNDSLIMIRRSSTHILRNTDQLLGVFLQPIMFLVLFAAVFGGAISKALPPGINYIDFLMPGIIVQTLAFGSTTTAIAICNDLQKGIVDRFRSLPMSSVAVLNGHVAADLLRNTISTLVMLVVGFAIGFRGSASVTDWLAIAGIVLFFTFAFSWLAAIVGLLANSIEAVQWLTFVMVLPLTFASTVFVPAEGMHPILRAFAENQPITQVTEAVRALMLGTPIGNYAWLSIAWSAGILIVAMPVAAWLFRRRTAS
jgi:ABC-2 type transport system permease protein